MSPLPIEFVNPDSPLSLASSVKPVPADQATTQQTITKTTSATVDTAATQSAAVQKTGGTAPGTQNQGITKKELIKSSAQAGAPQSTFKILLADNYAGIIKPVNASSIQQADWYRTGEPSKNPDVEGPFKRLPRTLSEYDNEKTDVASIRVVNSKNEDLVPPYSKFLLEGVTEGHTERSQIVETFGDFYVFLYGERPPIYTYSGTLINSKNANWVSDFSYYYDNYLRGTKCVENNAMLVLTYAGTQVVGFMLNASYAKTAATQGGVRFNFQVVITSKKYLGLSDDFASYVQYGYTYNDAKAKAVLESIAGKEGGSSSNPDQQAAYQQLSAAMNGQSTSGVNEYGE